MRLTNIKYRFEPAHCWDIIGDFLIRGVAALFVIVSILTFLEFSSFIKLLEKALRLNTTFAYVLGLIVVLFEFVSGILILLRKQLIISIIALLCTIGFLLLLSILEVFLKQQGGNVSLGLLHYLLSDMQIFFIQLIAVDIVVLFGLSTRESGILYSIKVLLVTIIFLGYINIVLIRSYLRLSSEIIEQPYYGLVSQLEKHFPNAFPRQAGLIVVFLLQHSDFNCPLCIESLHILSEELQSALYSKNKNAHVIALIREDAVLFNQRRVDYWKKANDFPFDTLFIPDTTFRKLDVEKSSVLVIQRQNNAVFHGNLPLSNSEIKTILNFIL